MREFVCERESGGEDCGAGGEDGMVERCEGRVRWGEGLAGEEKLGGEGVAYEAG